MGHGIERERRPNAILILTFPALLCREMETLIACEHNLGGPVCVRLKCWHSESRGGPRLGFCRAWQELQWRRFASIASSSISTDELRESLPWSRPLSCCCCCCWQAKVRASPSHHSARRRPALISSRANTLLWPFAMRYRSPSNTANMFCGHTTQSRLSD